MKQIILLIMMICYTILLSALIIAQSIKHESEIKALKAQIQACEARPACKRELEK